MHYKIDFSTFSQKKLMPNNIQNAFTDLLTASVAQGNYVIKEGTYEIKKQSYSYNVTLAQPVAVSSTSANETSWQIFPYTQPLGETGSYGILYVTNIHYTLKIDAAKQMVLTLNEPSKTEEHVIKTQSLVKDKKDTLLSPQRKAQRLANLKREAELGGRVKKLKMQPLIISSDRSEAILIMLRQPGDSVFNFYHDNNARFYKDEIFFLEFMLNLLVTYDEDIAKNSIVHNDIKPENILIADPFNFSFVDFGFARDFSEKTEGETFGSPSYISPEGLKGLNRTSKSDIYSLGRMFIALLGFSLCTKSKEGKSFLNTNHTQLEIPIYYSTAIRMLLKEHLLTMLATDPNDRPNLDLLIDRVRDILVIARTNKAKKDLEATLKVVPKQAKSPLQNHQERENLTITKVSIFTPRPQTPAPVPENAIQDFNMN